ncbi:MAG: hypothetical protein JJT96_02635 [Opitutales bacterium]|nr:hypothetical protein [Opitutales bacterium]
MQARAVSIHTFKVLDNALAFNEFPPTIWAQSPEEIYCQLNVGRAFDKKLRLQTNKTTQLMQEHRDHFVGDIRFRAGSRLSQKQTGIETHE